MTIYRPIQERYRDAQKASRHAKRLAEREKPLNDKLDAFYHGKSTDNTENYDKKEINSFMELN